MDGIFNVGTDAGAWFWVVKSLIVTALGVWFVFGLVFEVRTCYSKDNEVLEQEFDFKKIAFRAVIFMLAGFFCFVAFGKGSPPPVAGYEYEEGIMEMTDKAPDQKPIEEIRKEAEEIKDEHLKKVEKEGFADEAKEADDYIKKALEKSGDK